MIMDYSSLMYCIVIRKSFWILLVIKNFTDDRSMTESSSFAVYMYFHFSKILAGLAYNCRMIAKKIWISGALMLLQW